MGHHHREHTLTSCATQRPPLHWMYFKTGSSSRPLFTLSVFQQKVNLLMALLIYLLSDPLTYKFLTTYPRQFNYAYCSKSVTSYYVRASSTTTFCLEEDVSPTGLYSAVLISPWPVRKHGLVRRHNISCAAGGLAGWMAGSCAATTCANVTITDHRRMWPHIKQTN